MTKECEWREPPTRYCNHCWHEVSTQSQRLGGGFYDSDGERDVRTTKYKCCHCPEVKEENETSEVKSPEPQESYHARCRRIREQNK